MKKVLIAIMILLTNFLNAKSQSFQISDPTSGNKKAEYLKEDLNKFFARRVLYPREGSSPKIEGDVVLSCTITKEGKLTSLAVVSSPDISLSNSSLVAVNDLEKEWSPAKINNIPIDKNYLFIFRYRIYKNTQPIDYNKNAKRYFEKQKYEKALKLYNEAITDNRFNFEFYESRSKVKEVLGDMEGAKSDKLISSQYNDQIMSIINISAISITRTITGSRIEAKKVEY